MALARRPHTVGDRKRFVVRYRDWLAEGVTIVSATATASAGAVATIDGLTTTANEVIFFVNGGLLNEVFTIAIVMVDTKTGIKNDTIAVFVIAP